MGPETTPNLHDAPNGPHVHLETVPFLAQHLRSYVIRSPAQGLLPFPVILDFGCQSKIPWDRGRKRGDSDASLCHPSMRTAGSGVTIKNQGRLIPQASSSCVQQGLPRNPPTMLAPGRGLPETLLTPSLRKEGFASKRELVGIAKVTCLQGLSR